MSDLRDRLGRAFEFAAGQVKATVERTPDYAPCYTRDGRWNHGGEGRADWSSGLLAGMMWRIAERTGSPRWRACAEDYSRRLEPKKQDRALHDLGFVFLPTYLPWFRADGDPMVNDVLVTAGHSLAHRYNARGRFLRSWVAPASTRIDLMMSVPLILHAAIETGDELLYDQAVAHCRTAERTLVRPDGGTAQEAVFDLETGEFLGNATPLGFGTETVWARGQAWAISGFLSVYLYTNDPADLAVAERCADYYLSRCPDGQIPPWDFDVPPGPARLDDTSAAAIAASGLLDLATVTADSVRAGRYREAARATLDSLCTDRYMAWSVPDWEGVVRHGVYRYHERRGIDESLIWGDYYFLEAVDKALHAA